MRAKGLRQKHMVPNSRKGYLNFAGERENKLPQ